MGKNVAGGTPGQGNHWKVLLKWAETLEGATKVCLAAKDDAMGAAGAMAIAVVAVLLCQWCLAVVSC
eukprot:4656930-Alexandrium_andersonii.AAC.1